MISLTHYLEYNVTNSEVEALLLEAQLIKKFQPKFNVLLKDDKSFPYIKLRLDVDYPQLIKYRGKKKRIKKESSLYNSLTQSKVNLFNKFYRANKDLNENEILEKFHKEYGYSNDLINDILKTWNKKIHSRD
jgi:excinuclease UvrABC nuclease subunit